MEYRQSDPVRLNEAGDGIIIIDQTKLPGELTTCLIRKPKEMYDAIKTLAVRGAPCIGVFAGYCMAVLALQEEKKGGAFGDFADAMKKQAEYLDSSRPTAVNLGWALKRQWGVIEETGRKEGAQIREAVQRLFEEAVKIHEEDIAMCLSISEKGLSLLHDGDGILTHCNAGALATTRYGTALGPMLLGKERGYTFHVYSDETRPLLQGARLTAYEMVKAGIDETVICDNMASLVMKQGKINAVLVGCDRIASNGDFANKIGTSGVAILAKHYGIPFYVLGPTSTIDTSCPDGDHITIEERDGEEIRSLFYEKPMAPEEAKFFNPAFDVTDHELITAIITDRGILRPPFDQAIAQIMAQ